MYAGSVESNQYAYVLYLPIKSIGRKWPDGGVIAVGFDIPFNQDSGQGVRELRFLMNIEG